ncbi:MAG: CotH kinase family protein [Clostridia bacterium]|nr:CotH kinase family protein [Clostridia bacterium]
MSEKRFSRIGSAFLAFIMILSALLSLAGCMGEQDTPPSGEENKNDPPVETPGDPNPPEDNRPSVEEDPAVIISELIVVNNVGAEDANGKTSPWIEFHNVSDKEVDLADYTLSIDSTSGIKLPTIKIAAGEYAIVFANGIESDSSINATLASKGLITLMHGDAISYKVLYTNKTANHSFLTANGSETPYPTPGYETVREKDNLVISEVMASNSLFPIDGVICDWMEIYNASEKDIDLSDYYASSDSTMPYRARLPEIIIKSGEYIIICCEKDIPFKFSKNGESVYLTRNDGVLAASVTYEALEEDTVWTYDKGVVSYPSPGYENTEAGSISAIMSRKGLIISEVISSNTKYSPFNKKYCDMVEIYNSSDKAIDLSKYFLSDKESELQKYRLPEVTLEPGKYYVIYCNTELSTAAPIGISSEGEEIWLSNEEGYVSDALAVPAIPVNRSWGRYENKLVYFTTPSFGKANPEGYETITQTPLASHSSGVYSQSITVTLSGEGTIYYTTDGTKPTTSSAKYKGQAIKVDKTMAIRAIAYNGNKIPSYSVTYNYFIDIPDYELPIIKISMSNEDLFGEKGLYPNYNSKQEKQANCSFYIDGKEEFSIDCGIKVFGAYSRRFPKKSFQLEFRSEYGKGRLEYPIFENLNISSFNNIVLRSGSQNAYITDTMFTDEFMTSLAAYSGNMPEVLVQAYRPCNLYLNGEYWGVYFIREKIDDDFIADHFGVSKSSVTIIDWPNSVSTGSSSQGWSEIWKKIYTNKLNFAKDENYKWLADQIDLESFADMIIMRMYSGDQDLGNIRAFKSPEYDGGKWHFILYDNDISFRSYSALQNRFNVFLKSNSYTRTHALFRALMQNSQFKEYFLERLAFHLNTTISPESAQARFDEIFAELEHDMPYTIDRWRNDNNSYMTHLNSMTRWKKNSDNMRYWISEVRVKWFVKDVAKTLGFGADEIAKYMGEEFVKYLSQE